VTRAEVATTAARNLVVLRDGPSDRRWYTAERWAALRLSAQRMGGAHNEAGTLAYVATAKTEPHPDRELQEAGAFGTVWRWRAT